MARGRKRKPDNLKVLHGTFRNDRANPNAAVHDPDLPMSPTWLTPDAREYFGILKERLDSVGLASRTYTEIMAQTAQRLADRDQIRALITDRTKKKKSGWDDYRLATRYEVAVNQCRALLSDLGLTQTSIGKTFTGKQKEKKTTFGGL